MAVGTFNFRGEVSMSQDSRPSVLHLVLLKPSKYDDEGFVIRHWRGVLPSNTLACLHGLTEDVRQRGSLGDVDVRVHLLDEAVVKISIDKIVSLNRRPWERAVVGLVGVQSNQFARATDIALALRREGVPVIVGGFHVSGMLALFPTVSPEIQQLVDAGVSVVAGEVEHRWEDLLRDAYEGRLQPVYRFLNDLPDLSDVPRPVVSKRYLRRFIASNFGTVDSSRGCPFKCSFCTIINVQGRRNRHRSPASIADMIRRSYRESGVYFYFFTDDNFARNPAWDEIFDELIQLREQRGVPVEFMMQVDLLSHKIPNFIEKAAQAGCSNVFIGMESVNPQNLKDSDKNQNRVDEYKKLIDAWHDVRVSTHTGYIIGFPADTEESVRADVDRLISEIRPQRVSFFMMCPLPGSKDHQKMVEAGAPLDADYNTYDSFHESMPHPHMKNGAWTRAYREAWQRFYSFENMKTVLARADAKNYWDILKNFYWYKNSVFNEGAHPMITGFFRFKDRTTRREGFARESRLAHFRRRVPEIAMYVWNTLRLTLEMEELWLQTRRRSEVELRVLKELGRMQTELRRSLRISDIQTAYERAKADMPSIEVPSRLALLRAKISLSNASGLRDTRRDLLRFWISIRRQLRQGRPEVLLRVDRVVFNALREVHLTTAFIVALTTAGAHEAG